MDKFNYRQYLVENTRNLLEVCIINHNNITTEREKLITWNFNKSDGDYIEKLESIDVEYLSHIINKKRASKPQILFLKICILEKFLKFIYDKRQ